MPTAQPDSASVPSGGGLYAGRPNALPAWRPAQGAFSDLGASTLLSVAPTGWPNSDIGGPYSNWTGAAWAPWFGSQGGVVLHGSGHLSPGQPLWAGVWVWDVGTQTWVGRNVPSEALVEGAGTPPAGFNSYLESTITATLGHTYAPHTYDGCVVIPPSAGFAQGRLVRLCLPGSGVSGARCVHAFDLSSPTATPVRVIDALSGVSTSYAQADYDAVRGGIWALSNNGLGGVSFINSTTWAETHYPSINYNDYGDHSMVYVPANEPDGDYLVCFGRTGSGGADMAVHVSKIVSGAPTAFVLVSQSGTAPTDRRCGGVWCSALGCVVSYEADGSYVVHKLTPPAGDPTAGAWTWTTETLTGVGGAIPAKTTSSSNGAWGRFVYAPELGCFLWSDSVSKVMQAWRLTGT